MTVEEIILLGGLLRTGLRLFNEFQLPPGTPEQLQQEYERLKGELAALRPEVVRPLQEVPEP